MSRRRDLVAATIAVAAIAVLAGCATGAGMDDGTTTPRPAFRTTTPGLIAPTGAPAAVPPGHWNAIATDLAGRGVAGEAELVSAEAVQWRDGSLGCPAPDRSYTQQLIDGMRVVVRADGQVWDYRFGRDDVPRLCRR